MYDLAFRIIYYLIFAFSLYFLVKKYWRSEKPDDKSPVKLNKNTIIKIVVTAFISRLALLLLSWGATHLFGNGKDLLETWNHWDANHYIFIADNGYYSVDEGLIRLVFLPLYPIAVWFFNFIFTDARISSLIVSWLCLCGACIYLYKLVLLDWDKKAANRAVKYLLIFPVTVFLGAPFTESMFLLFCFGCLYYARIRRFAYACIFGGLAALTRSVGILLIVPVIIEMIYNHGLIPKTIKENTKSKLSDFFKDFKFIFIILLATVSYLLLNHLITGDALYFFKAQQEHWFESFGSYANTLSVTLGQILSPDNILRNKLTLWISQFLVLIIGGITLPILCKKMRVSYGAYAAVYIFIVFAPTWLLSGFRYYLGLAVLYPALAMLTKHKWADILLTIIFILLLPLYTYCFSLQWQVM